MSATISLGTNGSLTVSFTFTPGRSMMESEQSLQAALNEAGNLATGKCLEGFDSDGTALLVGGEKFTSKGKQPKSYQTPYGEVSVERHVYQSSQGGATFCPLEISGRVVRSATPLFARQVAHKYGAMNSTLAVADLAEHGRVIARSYLQELAADVASVAMEKEAAWSYVPTVAQGAQVKTIGVGVDGTCVLFCEEGYRQGVAGTLALYDEEGERLHTTYVAQAPEKGKAAFFEKMDRELAEMRRRFPQGRVAGIADGAHDLWEWLKPRTTWQVVDFWHACEHLTGASFGMARGQAARDRWLEEACHRLKHESGAAAALLAEMEGALPSAKGTASKSLTDAISYFTSHLPRMKYALHLAMHLPIGSGVTEAA